MGNLFTVRQDLSQVLCAQHVPQGGLSKQTGGSISVGDVGNSQGGILHSIIHHPIHTDCYRIFCQDLRNQKIPLINQPSNYLCISCSDPFSRSPYMIFVLVVTCTKAVVYLYIPTKQQLNRLCFLFPSHVFHELLLFILYSL